MTIVHAQKGEPMEKKKVSFTGLIYSLRNETNGCKSELCESCKETMNHAADMLEELLQAHADVSYQRDRAYELLKIYESPIPCRLCIYWHEVDSIDGTTFGICKRKPPIIRKNIFLQSGWFCADAERRTDGE